jgi:hypothetical protein
MIEDRMKETGQTRAQVEAEVAMMVAAQRRYDTGRLTKEDRAAIHDGWKHHVPQDGWH